MDPIKEGAIIFEVDGTFYNPKMRLNRDICVAMAKVLDLKEYLDALSASGIRGLRMAKEAGTPKVILNDASPRAHELIMRNLARNNLSCEAVCLNANVLLHQRRFDAVDLDPFGSPSPFLPAACHSAISYLFITATDTAPLCGAHLESGIRKYLATPLNTDYHREMGARVLLGLAAREFARLDKAMEPLLTHVTDHYIRTYLRVRRGARLADKSLRNLGYVEHCQGCGSFVSLREPRRGGRCDHCHGITILSGPLWLGKIHESDVVRLALGKLSKSCRAWRLLKICADEEEVPWYYDHHTICERLNITPCRIDDLVEFLRTSGHKASRTHFSGIGIKTNASLSEIEKAMKLA